MMMDLQTALVFVAVFLISGALLLFVSMFGIKEKSYEEALAEQRQQANALLGNQMRPKPKEKKQKKAGKKVKEKQAPANTENETVEESDNAEPTVDSSTSTVPDVNKHHVEFKEPTIEEPPKEPTKRRTKRDRIHSILLNRDISQETIVTDNCYETIPANHFEQRHPKDDFELLQSHLKEETKPEPVKEKVVKAKQNAEVEAKNNKKASKHQTSEIIAQTVEKEEVITEPVPVVPQSNGYPANSGKEKKKKKSEQNTLQQLTGDKQGVNLAVLTTLVRKAELSRSEVQIVIDMLLNKQHEAPAVIDEWSEGKADPIQKLKKQLAEKEKLYSEEQEALAGAQAKLKEVRVEQNAERSQLQQRIRALEENLNGKQLELQTVNNRLHSVNQKVQQLQAQLNEEIMKSHNLMEEHGAMQMQRQQFEIHLVQKQEADVTIGQLQNELQEFQARNRQLSDEIHAINETNHASQGHQQAAIVQLQHQIALMKKELEQKDEITRQLKESQVDVEHRLALSHKQENDLKLEISQLKSTCQQHIEEIRRLELNEGQSIGELQSVQKQNDDLQQIIFQLESDLKQLQDEKSQIQLTKDNISLEEKKAHEIEVMNLHNELASIKSQLQHTEKKHAGDLDAAVKRLQVELDEQRNKNNELRKKNWKVMEALNAAESRNKPIGDSKQSVSNVDDIVNKIRHEEQQNSRKLISRLLPDVELDNISSQDQWIMSVEKSVQNYLSELQRPITPEPVDNSEVTKLQAQILHYKKSIDDTEGILNNLQSHVEQEEIKWRNQLQAKQLEIEALKEQEVKQLQTQLAQLQVQLEAEEEAKRILAEECQILKSRSRPQGDDISQMEKLSEEVNRLTEQLHIEQKRNCELQTQIEANLSLKTQNHNSTNGPSVTLEQTLSSTSSAASSVTEVTVKKNNKKKKRKNNGN